MEYKENIIIELGKLLEYGILGLSAILALLGFFIFYKCISEQHPNVLRISSAKFFLGYALAFLVVSSVVKVADRYFVPIEANVHVEIEPWNNKYFERNRIDQEFYVKGPDGKKKYTDEGVLVTVRNNSEIECVVYPLHDHIDQLRKQLTTHAVNHSTGLIGMEGGIGYE